MGDEMAFRCQVCDETWEDFYDAKSHVWTSHQAETCGVAEWAPTMFVQEVPADA
jgi:hypothetical protein